MLTSPVLHLTSPFYTPFCLFLPFVLPQSPSSKPSLINLAQSPAPSRDVPVPPVPPVPPLCTSHQGQAGPLQSSACSFLMVLQLVMGNFGGFCLCEPCLLAFSLCVLLIASPFTYYPLSNGNCPLPDNLNEADAHTFHVPLQYELDILFEAGEMYP